MTVPAWLSPDPARVRAEIGRHAMAQSTLVTVWLFVDVVLTARSLGWDPVRMQMVS